MRYYLVVLSLVMGWGCSGASTSLPTIQLTAAPSTVTYGESSLLSWTSDAHIFAINGQPFDATFSGNTASVTPSETTVYTVTATNDAGSTNASITVTVKSSVPTSPIPFNKGVIFTMETGSTHYVFVPESYDSTHQTPATLFVWLHGCGGYSQYDIDHVSPGGAAQTWISLAVGGRENGCWDMATDPARVLNAIANLKTHFNIHPRRVVLGGYSSGGDLSYRLAFYNSKLFAGVLAENTSPFRDTGSSQEQSLAAAQWKFNVVHLAHLQDETYPIAGVRAETDAMLAAGFPLTRHEVAGTHYDDPGTWADAVTYLFPSLSANWTVP
jgi:predicted esterase